MKLKNVARAMVISLLVMSFLPVHLIWMGRPVYPYYFNSKFLTYDAEKHEFFDTSIQHENWWINGPQEFKTVWYGWKVPELRLFIVITKIVNSQNWRQLQAVATLSLQSFTDVFVSVIPDSQQRRWNWLLRQVLLPDRFSEVYRTHQVTRAP